MSTPAHHALAEGILTWMPAERELGRFGSVSLRIDGNQFVDFHDLPIGAPVRLSARILQVRHSIMPPDPARNLQATTPSIGERIELGAGVVFRPDFASITAPIAVGIAPLPGHCRPHQWLSPIALYRAHNHRVSLEIQPYRDFVATRTQNASAA